MPHLVWETGASSDGETVSLNRNSHAHSRVHHFCFADLLDGLKRKACGCFVGGIRRAVRAKEPALVESGAVYVYNYHMPVGRRGCSAFLAFALRPMRTRRLMFARLVVSFYSSIVRFGSVRISRKSAFFLARIPFRHSFHCPPTSVSICRLFPPSLFLWLQTDPSNSFICSATGRARCGGNGCTISRPPTSRARWRRASPRSTPSNARTPPSSALSMKPSPASCHRRRLHLQPPPEMAPVRALLLQMLPPRPKPKSCACEPSRPWIDRLRPLLPQVLLALLAPAPAGGRVSRSARKVRAGGPVVAVQVHRFCFASISSCHRFLVVLRQFVKTGRKLIYKGLSNEMHQVLPHRALL